MPKNQASRQQPEKLETGNIYFLYRPKVNEKEPSGLDDVQRLHVVLSPNGKRRYRSIAVAKKQLPPLADGQREQFWCFVEEVTTDAKAMRDGFDEDRYKIKTRGEQTLPAARPAGEGVYAIYREHGSTRLAYILELPEKSGAVQQALNLEPEASFILSIKNPEKPSPRNVGLADDAADFPEKLQQVFRDRRFADAAPPDFLDYEGCEFILVSAHRELREGEKEPMHPQANEAEHPDIFRDLRMRRTAQPTEPLFQGEWA